MIPLRDVIPSRTTPLVTLAVILATAAVFVLDVAAAGRGPSGLDRTFGLVPAGFTWPAVLTSLFIHTDGLHAATNLIYLWIFGENVEDRLGHGRFLLLYVLSGTAAALAQVAAAPSSATPIVGASGAIAGVLGAYFVLFPHSRVLTLLPAIVFVDLVEVPALYFLGLWIVLQLAIGIEASGAPDAALAWSQAAAFMAGAGLVLALRRPERMRIEWIERGEGAGAALSGRTGAAWRASGARRGRGPRRSCR